MAPDEAFLQTRRDDLVEHRLLTLVTSVNGHAGAVSLMCASMPAIAGIGTASTINALEPAARVRVSVSSVEASKPSAAAACAPSTERL